MLTIEQFTCSVQNKKLFSGDFLQLQPGRATVLLGASGSGKTRFQKGLAGLTNELAGTVKWQGQSIEQPLYNVIQMGMLFQNSALLDGLTVVENLHLAASAKDNDFAKELFDLGLSGSSDMYPGRLSEGLKRRVALLRAGLGNPDLICLDEPLAGLDADSRVRVLELVSRWLTDGVCLLLSTHLLTGLDKLSACYYAITGNSLQGEYGSLDETKKALPELFRETDEV